MLDALFYMHHFWCFAYDIIKPSKKEIIRIGWDGMRVIIFYEKQTTIYII